MTYIVIGSMLLALTAVAVYTPRIPASLFGLLAMWVLRAGGTAYFSDATMTFWSVATAIVLGITFLLPRPVAFSKVGVPFISTGVLAGSVVGMLLNSMAGIIIGGVAGALFGAIAFANTASGRAIMTFPSAKFFNYLAAKGLPAVVALAMAGACLLQLIAPAS